MTTAEEEAKRKADEEEAKRKAAESEEENSEDEDEELTVEQLKAQLADKDKHIRSLNKESAERRKRLEEFEKEKTERENAEKSEVEKAQARVKELEAKATEAQNKARLLELRHDFEDRVRDAKLEFRSSLAAKDAFKALVEIMGDDDELTEDHIKQLTKERDYLFGKSDKPILNNDGKDKGKSNGAVATKEAIAAKKFDL